MHSYRALVGSARLSMPINNNHLYRILITRSKQTNKRREMRRAVREEVGLMLWWLRADLRSVGPPTSKMYLRAEYRSTCYECFNATVRPSFVFSSPFCFASPPSYPRRSRKISILHEPVGNVEAIITDTGLSRLKIIRAYYLSELPARVLPFATDKLRISP